MKTGDELRSLKLTLGLYILIFALKLAVYLMSGVMVLLAEALHTLADIIVAAFLVVATIYSRKGADEAHMFGHGRAQNVAALVAATLFISFTSYKLYEEAIPRLFNAHEASYQNIPLVLAVIAVSMLIAAAPLLSLLRQRQRGAAAKAQLMELMNDELGLLAALIGTLCIVWGKPIGDPLAAMVVATIIAVNAAGLFRENLSFLLGRSPGREYLATVERLARSVPEVSGVHNLRAECIGPETVYAALTIEVPGNMLVEQADAIAEEVEQRVRRETGTSYCIVHVDPILPPARPPSVGSMTGTFDG